DARMQLAGSEHFDDVAHSSTSLLYEVVPGMDRELPDRRRVLARAQCWLQVELRLSAKRAIKDEGAAWREHRDVFGNAGSCDRIDEDVDPAAVGDFADALADHLALAIDGVIGAEIAGKARLLIAADHADHGEAGRLCQVDERIPHSACGCINEHALARSRPN